jgi:hypothetical protein
MMLLKTSLLLLGLMAAGISCYGSFEQGLLMDKGQISYLTLATPLVALGSLLTPYFAECAWKQGHHLKAIIWVFVLVPTTATVFYNSAERVHNAKAGMKAENHAQNLAVARAEKTLNEAKEARDRAETAAAESKKLQRKSCPDACLQQLKRLDDAFDLAVDRVNKAEAKVRDIQALALADSPLLIPTWLMPVALDLFAFMSIWSGLAISAPTEAKAARRRRKVMQKKPETPPKKPAPPTVLRAVP